MKQPSAWLPVAMSLAALVLALGHAIIFGVTREADEGTAAHIFQFLMAGQVPIVAYFAIRWIPRQPRLALLVLGVQASAGLAAFGAVYWLT